MAHGIPLHSPRSFCSDVSRCPTIGMLWCYYHVLFGLRLHDLWEGAHLLAVLPETNESRNLICQVLGQRLAKQVNVLDHFLAVIILDTLSTVLNVVGEVMQAVVEGMMLLDIDLHDPLLARELLDVGKEAGFLPLVVDMEQHVPVEDVLAEGRLI